MTTNKRNGKPLIISGPGAADFLTAPGGLDTPESGTKGMGSLRDDEGPLGNPARLEPDLEPHVDDDDPITKPDRSDL